MLNFAPLSRTFVKTKGALQATLIASLSLVAPILMAKTTLQSWSVDSDQVKATVLWTPRTTPDNFKDSGFTVAEWQAESFFLALPQGSELVNPANWTTKTKGQDVRVTVKRAQAGGLNGLQVFLEGSEAIYSSVVISLTGSGDFERAARNAQSGVELEPGLKTLAINSESVTWASSLGGATGRALPAAPGEKRVSYDAGNKLITVDPTAVGVTNLATMGLDWHGTSLDYGTTLSSDIWFYAPFRETLYDTQDSVLVAAAAAVPSAVYTDVPAFSTLTAQGSEVSLTRKRRFQDYTRLEVYRDDHDPGDRYFWYRGQNPGNSTYPPIKTLTGPLSDTLTSSDVEFTAEIWGGNATTSFPDHQADLTLNGGFVGRALWDGMTSTVYTGSTTLPSTSITEWSLEVSIPTPLGGLDRQAFEYFDLQWDGIPYLDGDQRGWIELEEAGDSLPRLVTMSGFPLSTAASDIAVLDVTDPSAIKRVTGFSTFTDAKGTLAIEWEAPADAVEYHVEVIPGADSPTLIADVKSLPALPAVSETVRGVIVVPEFFDATMSTFLADQKGSNYLVLDPQAAYDIYNGGQESPFAIRDAIRDLFDNSPSVASLPSILLIGYGTLDAKNHYGVQNGSELPSFHGEGRPTDLGKIQLTDDWSYTLLYGGDEISDASVGRIPAQNTANLQAALNRIAAYADLEEDLIDLDRKGVFVIDNDSEFVTDTPIWEDFYDETGKPYQTYSLASLSSTQVKDAISAELEAPVAGASLLFYIGHGANNTWAGEQLMNTSLVNTHNTQDRWPFVVSCTCLNHFYSFPGFPLSLGETWIFAPLNRGAIASFATQVNDFYGSQRLLAMEIMKGYEKGPEIRPRTFGQLTAEAFQFYTVNYPTLTATVKGYILFGDPESGLAISPRNADLMGWNLVD